MKKEAIPLHEGELKHTRLEFKTMKEFNHFIQIPHRDDHYIFLVQQKGDFLLAHIRTPFYKVIGLIAGQGLELAFSSIGFACIFSFISLLFAENHWGNPSLAFMASAIATNLNPGIEICCNSCLICSTVMEALNFTGSLLIHYTHLLQECHPAILLEL